MNRFIQLWKMFFSEEGNIFTYALAFSILLTLAPSLLIFVLIFAYAYVDFVFIEEILIRFLPNLTNDQLQQIVHYFIDREYSWISFLSTMIVSFYLASKSIYSFLLISARNEKVEVAKIYLRFKSIGIYIGFVLFIVIFLQWFYPLLFQYPWFRLVYLGLLFYLLYQSLHFRKTSLWFGLRGALFASISFSLLAGLFVSVVRHFTSYQVVYGPLASFVTLILAIYLISCIIYIGFCINIVWQKEDIEKLPLRYMVLYPWFCKVRIYLHQSIGKRK